MRGLVRKGASKLACWYATVHKCSINGEDRFVFLVERVLLWVRTGFLGVHSGEVSWEVFWYKRRFFWCIWGFFLEQIRGFFGICRANGRYLCSNNR